MMNKFDEALDVLIVNSRNWVTRDGMPDHIRVEHNNAVLEASNARTALTQAAEMQAAIRELRDALTLARHWGYGQPPPCTEEDIVDAALEKTKKWSVE